MRHARRASAGDDQQEMRISPRCRWWLSLGCLLFLSPRAAPADDTLRLAQPDAGRFPEIRLFCYPIVGMGRTVPRLTATQFHVKEDGKAATILSVLGGGAQSLAVCLVLDRSGSMQLPSGSGPLKIDAARQAASRFVNALRANDRAAVISFANESSLDQELTDDRSRLLDAIQRAQAYGSTVLYDAAYWGIQQVALRRTGGSFVTVESALADARRVVLLLTDGNDNGSRMRPDEVIAQARANGVSLYTVGLGADADADMLAYLARETGGEYYAAPDTQQLEEIYDRMARRFQGEYTVSYRSPRPEADGTRREVALTVDAPALSPATGWYQAPGRGSMVVAVGPAAGGASPVAGAPAPGASSPTAMFLIAAGIGGSVACGLLIVGLRRRGSPAARGGGAIDHGELWIRGPITRIGRDAASDVVVQSARVSRRHARIEASGGAYHLYDEGSSNGTRVNGREIHDSVLHAGDIVQFGNARFRFAGEPPPAQP